MPEQHTAGKHRRKPAALIAAVIALSMPAAVTAAGPDREVPPAPDGVDVIGYDNNQLLFTMPFGRVYGPIGSGFAVVFGGSIIDVCTGVEPPTTLLAATQRGDGTWDVTIPTGGVERQTFVYDISPNEGVFGFFGRICPQIGGGGDAPDPFAVGPAVLRVHQRDLAAPYSDPEGPQAPGGYQNSVKGEIVGADGNRFQLVARAKYQILADGTPDFIVDSLTLRPLG